MIPSGENVGKVEFDISKSATGRNPKQWILHLEFESSKIAGEQVVILYEKFKQFNKTNMVFISKDYMTLNDKLRGIKCNLPVGQSSVPPSSANSSFSNSGSTNNKNSNNNNIRKIKHSEQTFPSRFRAVDRGRFAFVNLTKDSKEFIKNFFIDTNVLPIDALSQDCVMPNTDYIGNALHGDNILYAIDLEKDSAEW